MAGETGLALVRKAAEILDYLVAGEASVAPMAESLGEPRSSVYRLLASLQAEGLVEPGTRRGRYRLGTKMLQYATAVIDRFDEREAARPAMERLHELSGETVFLCVAREDRAVCIDRIDGKRVRSLALQVGGSLPLHTGAASRAILAQRPREEWDAYVHRNSPLERLTRTTPATPRALVRLLEQTVHDGVAVSDQDVTVGVAALGVPLLDYQGECRGALSLSGVRESILGADFDQWRAALISEGVEVSRLLGAAPQQ